MIRFLDLSFTCRAALGLWTLLLCLAGIVGIVLSIILRRYRNAGVSLCLFVLSYLMWQVTVCFLYLSEAELTSALCIWIGHRAYVHWLLILLLLTVGDAVVLYSNRRYAGISITPLTIERCADELSCGVCFWKDNGHVVFFNACMNSLSIGLTGKPLMDGKRIQNAITDTIMQVDDRMWQFSIRDIEYGKEVLHELIASDVTELYVESRALKADNDRLAKLNEELRIYGLKIDETVRRQEMLQAKMNIHHEMNRLMLSTMAADLDNEEEMNRLFAQWEQNALFLCMESNEHGNRDAVKQLEELAGTLGIQILWEHALPENLAPKHRELFFAAAQEAVTNAVKHAHAKRMQITCSDMLDAVCCVFENDGHIPEGDISFTGGLANLTILAEEQHVSVSAEKGETFKLTLIFPKNQ